MPNRIIKESIRTSKTINALTDFQFRLWTYLITYVDDYGRGSADPEILKGFVFPRRKRVSESDIEKALADLAGMGCIHLYTIDGESYFCFPNWGEHQRIQAKKSRFPEPSDSTDSQQHSAVPNGESPYSTVSHRESPPESESEYESNANMHTSPATQSPYACPEPSNVSEPSAAPTVIELPLNDGTSYAVTQDFVDEMAKLYPAVDVPQQLNAMLGWLIGNPSRRKTKAGVKRFITAWLAREQDRGHASAAQPQRTRTPAAPKSGLSGDASYDLEAFERMTLYGTGGEP